ncbi:hypothetical protein MTO96_032415 [Rhipicephalus appendiculatus]
MDIDRIKLKRAVVRTSTTKLLNDIAAMEDDASLGELEEKINLLTLKEDSLKELDREIENGVEDDALEEEISSSENYKEKISIAKTKLQRMLPFLESELWWRGPHWLHKDEMHWPTTGEPSQGAEGCQVEERKVTLMPIVSSPFEAVLKVEEFSSFSRVVRVTAWVRRFVNNCRNGEERKSGPLRAEEVIDAESSLTTGMTTMGWCRVTTLTFALALLHQNGANTSGSTPKEGERASVSSLSTSLADVVLVSYHKPWNEQHASFARLLDAPITTWHVTNQALRSYVGTSIARGKRPVFVAADPGELEQAMDALGDADEVHCVPWLFVRHHSLIREGLMSQWKPHSMCDVVGVLGMNFTVIRNIFWPLESSVEMNPSSEKMLDRLRVRQHSSAKSLSGKHLKVACYEVTSKIRTSSSCNEKFARDILALLTATNITVTLKPLSNLGVIWDGLYGNAWDIFFDLVALRPVEVPDFDFPFILFVHRTFYSRLDDHRVVTPLEVADESSKLVASTVFLLTLAAAVAAVFGEKSWSALRGFSDLMMLLLGAFLATSADDRSLVRRVTALGKALIGICFVAVLPLSVYFRSELTSIVTIRRPAYRIDTLQELEDALDRGEVAPCAVVGSSTHFELNGDAGYAFQTSLMNKLQLAFARYGNRVLAVENPSACLRCASRRDRVCYSSLEYIRRNFLKNFPNVGEFVEHLGMQLVGFRMHKRLDMYKPMRRLFLSFEEQRLMTWFVSKNDHEEVDTKFDMSSLFVVHVVLLAACCVVLLLEVVVAMCLSRWSGAEGR